MNKLQILLQRNNPADTSRIASNAIAPAYFVVAINLNLKFEEMSKASQNNVEANNIESVSCFR